MGAELFHADGQTDMTKLTFTFRSFAKAPQIQRVTTIGLFVHSSLYCPKTEDLNEKKNRNFSSCLVYCRMHTLTVKWSHKSKLHDNIRGLLEKYPTFGREKETGLLGALDT